MSMIIANKPLRTIITLLVVLGLTRCSTQSTHVPVSTQSIAVTASNPLPLPTRTEPSQNDLIEDHCVKSVSPEELLSDADGVLLLKGSKKDSAPILFNLLNNSQIEIPIAADSFPHDFIISPNRKLIAMAISGKTPPSSTIELLIVDPGGSIQSELPWKQEWGRLAAWLDDEQILLARQADLQLSIPNPESIILLDVNERLDREIQSMYPDYNKVNSVRWNLINYVYSRDFTHVLYPTSEMGPDYINYVALWDLTNKKTLATLPVQLSETSLPEWSPNGNEILVAGSVSLFGDRSGTWGGQELFTIDKNGKITQITHFTNYYSDDIKINHYTWSPDGENIAFWMEIGAMQNPQLVVLNVKSSKVIN